MRVCICGRPTAAKRSQSVIGSFLLPVPVHLRTRQDRVCSRTATAARQARVIDKREAQALTQASAGSPPSRSPPRPPSVASCAWGGPSRAQTCVENKVARTLASELSGGSSQRQSMPQTAPNFGQPWPISCMVRGYTGLVFDIGSCFTVLSGDTFFLDLGEAFLDESLPRLLPRLTRGILTRQLSGAAIDWRLIATAGAAAGGATGGCVKKRGESVASDCIVGTGPTTRSATYSPTASSSRLGDAMSDFRASIAPRRGSDAFKLYNSQQEG